MHGVNPDIKARISSATAAVRAVTTLEPEIAIILGSGLGPLAEQLEDAVFIPYGDLPGFPVSTAPGHKGRAVLGSLEGRRIIAFQGRVHVYEGYSAGEVAIPVYLAHALGATSLIVTNACGGLHPEWSAGDIMLQTDYLNMTGMNPLIGPRDVVKAATNLQSHATSNVANVSQRAAIAALTGDLSAVAQAPQGSNLDHLKHFETDVAEMARLENGQIVIEPYKA